MYHLGRRVREKLAGSTRERDRPILDLTWDYPTVGPTEEPDAEAVLAEIGGFDAERTPLVRLPAAERRRLDHLRLLDLRRLLRGRREPDGAAQARRASRAGWRRSGPGPGR